METHADTKLNIEFLFGGDVALDFRSNFNAFVDLRQKIKDRDQKLVIGLGRDDFIHQITLHMPEVAERIREQDFGDLHREMGAMKGATEEAILAYCFHTVRRHLSFIGYLFEQADSDLYAAILESYLEPLFLGQEYEPYLRAKCLLQESLKNALARAELRRFLLKGGAA